MSRVKCKPNDGRHSVIVPWNDKCGMLFRQLMSLSRQPFIPITQYSDSPIFRQFADVRVVRGVLLEIVARLYAAPVLWNSLPDNYRNCSNFNEFKNLISFWNGKSYTCIAGQNSYFFCEGRYTKTFSVLLFICFALHDYHFICVLYFVLCFAVLLCFIALCITCFAI
jgi:hypothetical protein